MFGEFDGFVDGHGRVDVRALVDFVNTDPEDGALDGSSVLGRRWVCSATRVS